MGSLVVLRGSVGFSQGSVGVLSGFCEANMELL